MEFPDDAPCVRLHKDGYMTIPILDSVQITVFREAFKEAMTGFREFRRHADDPTKTVDSQVFGEKHSNYVMGGFGGFGNPSSFHNPYVRTLRLVVMEKMIPFFREYIRYRTSVYDPDFPAFPSDPLLFHVEQLFGRMCLRPAGTSVTREQWHRDLNPTAQEDDIVFGGWLNLDPVAQYFSCSPSTHTDVVKTTKKGFTQSAKPSEIKKVLVPSGHLLVFYQRLLHEVAPRLIRTPSLRQFICWRVTQHPNSTLQEKSIHDIVTEQAVPRLPSYQIPPLFGQNHMSFHLHKETGPIRWSDRLLRPECIVSKEAYAIGHRHMHSLMAYKFTPYTAYDPVEIAIMMPQQSWELPDLSAFSWSVGSIMDLSLVRHARVSRLLARENNTANICTIGDGPPK